MYSSSSVWPMTLQKSGSARFLASKLLRIDSMPAKFNVALTILGTREIAGWRFSFSAATTHPFDTDLCNAARSQAICQSGKDAARPTLQRVYGSGSKTKHASIVILADREYVRELQGDETAAQVFILKNRDGRTGRVKARFNIRKLRFDGIQPIPD